MKSPRPKRARGDALEQKKRKYNAYHYLSLMGIIVSLLLIVLFYETSLRDTINMTHLALVAFVLLISLYLRLCANSLKQSIDTQEATILLVKLLLAQKQKSKDDNPS